MAENKFDYRQKIKYDLHFLSLREKDYESGKEIMTDEIDRENYLRHLSKNERSVILYLFKDVLKITRRHYSIGLTALAVGTTTYKGDYWLGLKRYLEQHDKKKLYIVKRRGEDIDIVLCNDLYLEHYSDWEYSVKLDLENSKIKYKFNNNKKEDGTGYLTVPKKYIKKEKQGVIRYKRPAYCKPNFIINIPGSRNIHLSFERMVTEMKLEHERVNSYPFSLLFRHADIDGLEKIIKKIDSQLEIEFPKSF